ncbi:MAG: hypothetical protein ACREXP_32190, partial [Steroidobacteraceae bacterium]
NPNLRSLLQANGGIVDPSPVGRRAGQIQVQRIDLRKLESATPVPTQEYDRDQRLTLFMRDRSRRMG